VPSRFGPPARPRARCGGHSLAHTSKRRCAGTRPGWSVAAFDPDGERIVTASRDGRAALWDAETGENLAWFDGRDDWVSWASFSPDGRLVATASRDGTARLWDAATGEELTSFGEGALLSDAAFDRAGLRIVTGGGLLGTARV
jgi:WD40 repeat protein